MKGQGGRNFSISETSSSVTLVENNGSKGRRVFANPCVSIARQASRFRLTEGLKRVSSEHVNDPINNNHQTLHCKGKCNMTRDEIFEMLRPWGWSAQALDLGIGADFRCEYCSRDLIASVDDYDAWQIDHILPRIDDREALWNLALSCKTCNFLKRHSTPTTPIDPRKDRATPLP